MNYIEREIANKKKWTDAFGAITDSSGIYILRRMDEDGIKFAYIGQAKHILTRLGQHLDGYQHIDLSLKKHACIRQTTGQVGTWMYLTSQLKNWTIWSDTTSSFAPTGAISCEIRRQADKTRESTASRQTSPQKATTTAWRKARKTQRKSWQHSLKNISMPTSKVSRTKSKNAS